MLGWLQALFLDSKARESLSRAKDSARARPAAAPAAKAPVRPAPIAAKAVPSRPSSAPAKAQPAGAADGDRAALLREAAEIHRAKRKILDALSDEDRAKLVSMAILTFLNQGAEPPPDPKTRK